MPSSACIHRAPTLMFPLSLHDALPIFKEGIMPIIDRSGAEALMPEDAVREILTGVVEKSTVLEYGRRLPDMASAQRRLPISDALPMADRKSTRLNSSHVAISYAVFCLHP